MAVAVRQHDVAGHDAGMGDDLVRSGGPVQHEVGRVRPEHPGGVALGFSHDSRVVEQRAELCDRDRQIGAEQGLAVEVVEGLADL